jgi:hypothetical protein
MSKLFALLPCLVFLCSCAAVPQGAHGKKPRREKVRLTVYHGHEDRFGNRIASSNHARAVQGVTVAAEKAIPFGTPIEIPALAPVIGSQWFTCQDRGSAVERRRASHGQYMVIDVYVASRQLYRWCRRNLPELMEATIYL